MLAVMVPAAGSGGNSLMAMDLEGGGEATGFMSLRGCKTMEALQIPIGRRDFFDMIFFPY
jgi:hypothetical protein